MSDTILHELEALCFRHARAIVRGLSLTMTMTIFIFVTRLSRRARPLGGLLCRFCWPPLAVHRQITPPLTQMPRHSELIPRIDERDNALGCSLHA